MATVDTSIYNALLRPVKSVAEYDAEAMANQQNKLALQMNRAKMDEYQRGQADEQQMRGLVSQFGADKTANYNKLLGSGRLKEAQSYEKANFESAKAQREAEKSEIEGHFKQFELVGQIMGGAKDQASYDLARAQMAQIFPDRAAQMPTAYDPALIEQRRMQAMGVKEQLEQMWKQKGFDLDVQKFTEDKRKNSVSEKNQAGQLAVSQGNLGVSRERLALDKAKPVAGSAVAAQLKPMPTSALKMQQAELDAIGIASGIQADLGAVEKQIKDGKLDFGPVNNLIDRGRNLAGMSSEASRNKASFKSTLEKLRNDSLRLNTGVQTDGDAQRAWSELFENINDKGVVTQRLAEIKKLNERAVKLRKMNVDGIRANYGRDPADTSGYEKQEPALNGGKTPDIDALLKKYGG